MERSAVFMVPTIWRLLETPNELLGVGKRDSKLVFCTNPLVGLDQGDQLAKDLRDVSPVDLIAYQDELRWRPGFALAATRQ